LRENRSKARPSNPALPKADTAVHFMLFLETAGAATADPDEFVLSLACEQAPNVTIPPTAAPPIAAFLMKSRRSSLSDMLTPLRGVMGLYPSRNLSFSFNVLTLIAPECYNPKVVA